MKKNKYVITAVIVFLIFLSIFLLKGIFPFGDNSIIWSDLHEQITAIYYHLYDAIRGDKSLLIDFTTGGGVNFMGVMAYYILSPFTLLLLLFPRALVFKAVSIVVVFKVMVAAMAALYFISKYFKKIKPAMQIFLALLYAFSSYTLILYIITPWMDIVYLFPFLMIGLKKLLDLEDSKMYILFLTASLICCFYLSFITLIFIILSSLCYLYFYNKENRKKAIFNLGVSTVISILLSSCVTVPSLLQVFSSQRAGFDFNVIINSKFGPLSDKIAFIFGSGILCAMVIILLMNYKNKKHAKFVKFLFCLLILVGLPILIEPINKMWHFGSYVYFPYRYGFILIFLLLCGACYFLNNISDLEFKFNINKYAVYSSIFLSLVFMIFLTVKYSNRIMKAVNHLTLTRDKFVLIMLFVVFVLVTIATILICCNKKLSSNSVFFYILIISNILFNCYFYVGGYDPESKLLNQYKEMLDTNKIGGVTGSYYLKEVNRDFISNYGNVTGINSYSHFTSLTDKINFETMQRLGYDSFWMDTQSIGGNLFSDIVLAQKYIVTKNEFDDPYYEFINSENGVNYYEFKDYMSYGYLIKNNSSLENSSNSFDASNIVYNSITGNGSIFDIYRLFDSNSSDPIFYNSGAQIDRVFDISGRKRVYLEVFSSLDSSEKINNYNAFDIYVNGELFMESYPNDSRNGSLLLGTFENEQVSVKIVATKNVKVRNITIGLLDLEKLDSFIKREAKDTKVSFKGSNINVVTDGVEGEILFLPITYIDGYFSNSNEIFRVFDNFIGIRLHDGVNNIEISYIPKGLMLGFIITLIGIILYFVWIKVISFINLSILYDAVYFVYILVYILVFSLFYIIPLLGFVKSFIF